MTFSTESSSGIHSAPVNAKYSLTTMQLMNVVLKQASVKIISEPLKRVVRVKIDNSTKISLIIASISPPGLFHLA